MNYRKEAVISKQCAMETEQRTHDKQLLKLTQLFTGDNVEDASWLGLVSAPTIGRHNVMIFSKPIAAIISYFISHGIVSTKKFHFFLFGVFTLYCHKHYQFKTATFYSQKNHLRRL